MSNCWASKIHSPGKGTRRRRQKNDISLSKSAIGVSACHSAHMAAKHFGDEMVGGFRKPTFPFREDPCLQVIDSSYLGAYLDRSYGAPPSAKQLYNGMITVTYAVHPPHRRESQCWEVGNNCRRLCRVIHGHQNLSQ